MLLSYLCFNMTHLVCYSQVNKRRYFLKDYPLNYGNSNKYAKYRADQYTSTVIISTLKFNIMQHIVIFKYCLI